MTTYNITARKTSPITPVTVEAASSEEAIAQVVASAAEGEQIEVLQCIAALPDAGTPPAPTGTTGATGPAALEAKPTRAQLNEMTKDELLAVSEKEGAEANHNWNKDAIVEAILKHRRA